MATKTPSRFLRDSGSEAFNGNELIFKGALETEGGVHLLTGYPGSPVATFFDVMGDCADLLKEHGIEGRIANNEALASAAVNGSQMGPLRAIAAMKSVGVHVAADALALGNLAGPHPEGGVVIVIGDDPWSESTQVPADSRFLCKHLFIPVLEPSTPQEAKDYVNLGFQLSQVGGVYVGYLITTTLADGGGTVECYPNHYPLTNANQRYEINTHQLDLENKVLLPPRTGRRELDMPERHERLLREAERLKANRLLDVPGANELLIVTSGMAWQYVRQSLRDMGLDGKVPVLKLGVTYPLSTRQFEPLLERFAHVLVVEERRGFIEEQIAAILIRYRQRTGAAERVKLWGKQFPADSSGLPAGLGLNGSIVTDRLGRFLRAINSPLAKQQAASIERELQIISDTAKLDEPIIPRTPTFCPGCPHRDSAAVLLEIKEKFTDPAYMRKMHRMGPVDLVFHGDTGCYTMLMFEPTTPLMHNYSGMGLGGGTGSGIDPFIHNKQVVFMGDSTFFHSGWTAISNSIVGRQDLTYIILANDTTAMTGHQPLPSLATDLLHRPIQAQQIEQVVRSIVGDKARLIRTDPSDRNGYRRILEDTILCDGVKVIIAEKECGITRQRKKLRQERSEAAHRGYVRRQIHMNITPEVCEDCLQCTQNTGCPGLTVVNTDYGPKVATDLSWCVNDGACAKLGVCPAFEEVIVKRRRPPRARDQRLRLEDIPEPAIEFTGDVWRAWLAGVGGMGIGTAASILVVAGRHAGYHVQFSDKKGLAIRNGSVYSQLIFSKHAGDSSMTLGYGKADLLLAVDLLEAARAVNARAPFRVATPNHTAAVVNIDRTPTIRMLLGKEDFDPRQMEAIIRRATRPDRYFSAGVSELCERIFGTKLYANITMLGIAYQLGLIPVPLDAIKEGIRQTIRADFRKNLRAFDVGRKLVSHPELFTDIFGDVDASRSLARTVRAKAAYLNMELLGTRRALRSDPAGGSGKRRLRDTKLARTYKHMVYTTLRACRELDRGTMLDIAVRIYDLVQWGGVRYAQRYVQRIRRTFLADDERFGFHATKAVVWNLAKLMLIKDEFYVAHLLTSFEKIRRDRQRYNVNPANGDRLKYRRTFHPRFFGKQVDIRIPHWSLYILRNMRALRHVMPWFRRDERRFLRWYEQLVDGFSYQSPAEYSQYVEALRCVENVKGYAEVREPRMRDARARAEQLLATFRRENTPTRVSAT